MPFYYRTDSFILENVCNSKDLGVVFDAKLKGAGHIEMSVNKARSLLGFMKR